MLPSQMGSPGLSCRLKATPVLDFLTLIGQVSLSFPKGTQQTKMTDFFLVSISEQTEKQKLIFVLAAATEKKQTKGPPACHSQHYYYNYYHNAFTLKRRHLRQATKAAGSVSLPPSHDFPPPSHSACVTRREVRTERQSRRKKRRVGGSEKPFYN